MRCNRCGSENKDGSVFCAFCGGKIAPNDNSSTVNTPKKVNGKGNDGFTDVFNDSHLILNNVSDDSTSTVNNDIVSNNNFDVDSDLIDLEVLDSSDTDNGTDVSSGTFSAMNYQNTSIQNNTNNSQNINVQNDVSNSNQNANVQNSVNMEFNNSVGVSNINTNNGNYQNTNSNSNFNASYTNMNNSSNQSNMNNFNNSNNSNPFGSLNNMGNNNAGFGYGQYNSNQSLNVGAMPNFNNNAGSNKKIGKLGIIAACVVTVIIFVFVFDVPALLSGKRTIMVYMIGSDLESQYAAASSDIEEMKASGLDFDKVNVLIYTGGAKKWLNAEIPDDKNAIFKLTSSGLVKLEEYDKSSMVDPDSLARFLNYGYDHYKASKYSLILWDHGGGPILGYGFDENYVGTLTLAKLKQGLSNSKFSNKKLEMIGFDACLMSSVEVADALSDYANYMLASQEVEPGFGWDYSFLSTVTNKTSTVEMGTAIIDYYGNYYKGMNGAKGITLSLLDLSKINAVESKINDLFKDVDDNLTIDYSTVSRTRNSAKSFGKVSVNTSYDLVDLYDLVDKMPSKYATKIESLQGVLNDFVVYQTTDLESTYGVSIYFPYENKQYINEIITLYKGFDFAKGYTNFITNFSSKLNGTKASNWRLSDNVPVVEKDNVVSVNVPSDVSENYSSASYVIFEKSDNNYYIPRYKGTDVTVSGNTFSTTVSKKGLVASDDTDTVYLTVLESEKGKGYVKYSIPSILQNWGDSISDNFEMKSAYIEFIVDKDHPKGYISSAVPIISDDNLVAPKISYNLKDFKLVQLWNFSYKIFDDAGNYTTDWESAGTMNGFEFDLSKKFELEFRDLDVSKEYYILFYISDSQGNRYTTNAVKIKL